MPTPRFTAKIEAEAPTPRLAVLIDADNAQAVIIENLLLEIASLGEATVKRIYGDFTDTYSASWKKVLQKFAIKPVQQFAYTVGKNATDCSLIIDAMDLLYTGTFDGFCLVSSDSDFTGLAMRLREGGLKVYGFGEKKTPEAFRSACHKFTFTEILRPHTQDMPLIEQDCQAQADTPDSLQPPTTPASTSPNNTDLPKELLLKALEQSVGEDKWVTLSEFGSYLNKVKSDFDSRNYGFKKLSDLVKGAKDIFVVEERPVSGSDQRIIYIRSKKR
ncbi:NYN domain-containing protein [Deltaproteobacteria bacterium OttesenSCG-928-M10]|nr:NYN domain-containing protein [Deltaproteobacteria bacterium OttesenSCG-928-M10]